MDFWLLLLLLFLIVALVQAFWKYTSFSYHKNAFIYCMVKLYDHRIIQREAVQTYEAHVNSHTRLQLGVDPSERFFISGGEDCKLRLWSIKSGELLFEEKQSAINHFEGEELLE